MIEFDERRNRPNESYAWYGGRWGHPMSRKNGDWWFSKYIHYKNLEALKETEYRYSAFEQYHGDMNISEYCRLFSRYPAVEILVKNGMSSMVKEHFLKKLSEDKGLQIFLRQNAEKICMMTGVNSTVIKMAYRRKVSISEALSYYKVKNSYTKAPKGINRMELHKYLMANGIDKYDYYHYCETVQEAKEDILAYGFTFPKDFHQTERRLMRRIKYRKVRENKKRREKLIDISNRINEIVERIKMRLDARVGKLSVVFPITQKQYTNEGNAMKNCIGGYYNRTIQGGSICFFIRNNGKNFADVEMSTSGEVRQCLGKRNTILDHNVVKFAEEVSVEIAKEYKKRKVA